MTKSPTPQDAAAEMAAKVREKAIAALAPLAEEMRVGKWGPEFRIIMWEAVARVAMSRCWEAKR